MSYSFDRPAYNGIAVTPSDATTIAPTKGLYVGTGGPVAVVFAGGGEAILNNTGNGTYHPVTVVKVKATGTGASDIVALY